MVPMADLDVEKIQEELGCDSHSSSCSSLQGQRSRKVPWAVVVPAWWTGWRAGKS